MTGASSTACHPACRACRGRLARPRRHGGFPGPAHGGVVRCRRWRRNADRSEDGRRLGYIRLRPATDGVTDEACGYISLLATTPEAEGTGVAARLMAAAEDWARGRGYRLLSLDVFADNKRAVEFYERRGFRCETFRMVKPL